MFGSTFVKGGSLALTSFLLRYKPFPNSWQCLAPPFLKVEKDGRFGSTFLKGGSLALTSFLLRYKPLQKEWQCLALTSL
jgi:hypothetical protein